MKILFDTNALLLPFTDGTNLDDELTSLVGAYEPMLPSVVHAELEHLATGDGKTARAAKGALRLCQHWQQIEVNQPGDDGFLEAVAQVDYALTNDKRLGAECKKRGVKLIVAKSKGHLRSG